jgi:DNA-binding MarR family transcriptional regulator
VAQIGDARLLVQQCREAITRLTAVYRPEDLGWLNLEMSMGQLKAMIVLNCSGHLRVGGLAKALGIAEPSASILADKLERQGLAVREVDPADRRRTPVVVTAAGRELVSRLRSMRDVRLNAWLSDVDDDDLDALLRGLTALLRAADNPGQCALPEQAR